MLILGIDDAGRGPLIGPMTVAGVLIEKTSEDSLKRRGVADSKALTDSKRKSLDEFIKGTALSYHVIATSPEDIDKSINSGINLNTLEAMKMASIINEINNKKFHDKKIKVVIDCPSTNIPAWTQTLKKYINHSDNLDISCEHKADANHVSVSAASILAKNRREEEVAKLKKKYKDFGDLGSGYPSDPVTISFLQKQGKKLKDTGIFRKTWATWKDLFPEDSVSKAQQKLF